MSTEQMLNVVISTVTSLNVTDLLNDTGTGFNSSDNATVPLESPSNLQIFKTKYARVHGYISVCVCLFGILANIANIVVLTRRNMITSTNVILTWLAVADLFTMVDYFPFAMHFYIFKDPDLEYHVTRGHAWILYLLFHANFSVVCHSCAIWLTIALATFRFICIWFPTKGSFYCTPTSARKWIAIIVLAVLVMCVPNFIVNTYSSEVKNTTTGNASYDIDVIYHVAYRNQGFYDYIDSLNKMIQAILFKIVPCALLTILTILLITAMHKAHKKRMALKNQGKREESDRHGEHNRTTGMLLAVVMLFLLTELPQGILTILSLSDVSFFYNVYLPLGDMLDITALCNNAINFVLYSTMSRQFRDTFMATFCWFCPKSKPGWMKMKLVKTKPAQNGSAVMTEHTHV